MSDLSELTLPNDNTVYSLKDETQTRSDHRHYDSDLVPLVHKVYESTSYYATSQDYEGSSWYFMSVIPDDWYKPWTIKLKFYSYCPSYTANKSLTYSTISGRADGVIYANWNEVNTTAHYYVTVYPLKKAGYDAGFGHAIAISIYGASNYTKSAYYRTFEIDYYSCENCTVTILDTPVKWSNWNGTGSTNYGSITALNAYSRGLQETGDTDTSVHTRLNYFSGKTGTQGVWASSLFMETTNGTFENICTASDGTATSSNRTTATTKLANTTGFRVGSSIWYTNTGYNANTNISGSGNVYSSISSIDSRYAFNTELTAGFWTTYKPLYLVGTIHSDGLYYLDSTWWTQTPNDTSKVYVLVGGVYTSSTSNCYYTLYEQNKWYRYDGTNLIEISNDALSVNGHTVETDVPTSALFTDTKNTAGSTDTSSKIYLIGATSQAANPQTYSDNEVYATSGVLTTKSVQVGGTSATMQYNSTTQAIEFIFN